MTAVMETVPRRSRRWPFAVAALAALACYQAGYESSYSPEQDDAAMAAIASAWSEPGGLTLTLCEDVARAPEWTGSDCQIEHLVRGGGLGTRHTEHHDGSCAAGGCPFSAASWVRGTASGAGLVGDVPVKGTVWLQSSYEEDPYGLPYSLDLACDDVDAPCTIYGELDASGAVAATLVLGPSSPGQAESRHALARTGAAVCP